MGEPQRSATTPDPRCPICGGVLREAVSRCGRCPMGSGCGMICCENCGYETVAPKSAVVDFARKIWKRRRNLGRAS